MEIVLDIETNRQHDTIWMAAIAPVDGTSDPVVCFTADELVSYLTQLKPTKIIGHNLIGFDCPVLLDVWELDLREFGEIVDTYVIGHLLYPTLSGGHSLKNWALLAGEAQKGEFDDYDLLDSGGVVTEEMIEYCIDDVLANISVYNLQMRELERQRFDPMSVELEHNVAWIIRRQERKGFFFKQDVCWDLWSEITNKIADLETHFKERFPDEVVERVSEKTGKPLKPRVVSFNPGSRKQVGEKLTALGAKFSATTPTGQPKISEETLAEVAAQGIPLARTLSEYFKLVKTQGLLKQWYMACDNDMRIHGRVRSNGAVTGRMTHSSPNLAQIPSMKECRELFTVPKGCKLVGCDAAGLELRMLAHYMQDDEYTKEVVHGDVHTRNQKAAGLGTRAEAKTFIYAFLYGAGDKKIGSITGGGAKQGALIKEKFLRGLPALSNLITKVDKIVNLSKTTNLEGDTISSVPGLDGRRIWIRKDNAHLNSLLQGAGAVVMKLGLVIADEMLRKQGIEDVFVCNVHDEWQCEVPEERAEEVGKILQEAIVQAGVQLKLRCPLDATYHIGNDWSETH